MLIFNKFIAFSKILITERYQRHYKRDEQNAADQDGGAGDGSGGGA